MSLNFSLTEVTPDAVLTQTHEWLRDAAENIALTVQAVRRGDFTELKQAGTYVRDLRAAMELFVDERNRVEKLRKQIAGTVVDGKLDLDAARDEIGRRLACLRDARGD